MAEFELEVLGLLEPVAVAQVEEDWEGEEDRDTLPVPHTVGVRVEQELGEVVVEREAVLVPHPVEVTDKVGEREGVVVSVPVFVPVGQGEEEGVEDWHTLKVPLPLMVALMVGLMVGDIVGVSVELLHRVGLVLGVCVEERVGDRVPEVVGEPQAVGVEDWVTDRVPLPLPVAQFVKEGVGVGDLEVVAEEQNVGDTEGL